VRHEAPCLDGKAGGPRRNGRLRLQMVQCTALGGTAIDRSRLRAAEKTEAA
jgi:hypothetical protein